MAWRAGVLHVSARSDLARHQNARRLIMNLPDRGDATNWRSPKLKWSREARVTDHALSRMLRWIPWQAD